MPGMECNTQFLSCQQITSKLHETISYSCFLSISSLGRSLWSAPYNILRRTQCQLTSSSMTKQSWRREMGEWVYNIEICLSWCDPVLNRTSFKPRLTILDCFWKRISFYCISDSGGNVVCKTNLCPSFLQKRDQRNLHAGGIFFFCLDVHILFEHHF